MSAKVTLNHGMSFTGIADSGFSVNLGTSPAVGGDDNGLRPMELVLLGLLGCTAMDVISILRKKRQHVTAFEVSAETERAEKHPKVFTSIEICYKVTGIDVDPDAVARAIELSETKYCPAQAMLVRATPIRHTFEIIQVTEGEPV